MDATTQAQLDAAASYLRNSAPITNDEVVKDGTLTMCLRRGGTQQHRIDRIAVHGELSNLRPACAACNRGRR